jgi:hypothetical protein
MNSIKAVMSGYETMKWRATWRTILMKSSTEETPIP